MRRLLTVLTFLIPLVFACVLAIPRYSGSVSPDAADIACTIALFAGWIGLLLVRWSTSPFKWLWFAIYPIVVFPATGFVAVMVIGLTWL